MDDAKFRRNDGGSSEQGTDKGTTGAVKDDLRQTYENVRDETVTQAKQATEHARQQAEESLESGKDRLAAQVGSVSRALHRSSESFRDDGQDELADQSERLSQRVEDVRTLIDDYGFDGAYEEVRHLARNRPMWLIGGAAILGLGAAAVLSGRKTRR